MKAPMFNLNQVSNNNNNNSIFSTNAPRIEPAFGANNTLDNSLGGSVFNNNNTISDSSRRNSFSIPGTYMDQNQDLGGNLGGRNNFNSRRRTVGDRRSFQDTREYSLNFKKRPLGFCVVPDHCGKDAYVSYIEDRTLFSIKTNSQIVKVAGQSCIGYEHEIILNRIQNANLPLIIAFQKP